MPEVEPAYKVALGSLRHRDRSVCELEELLRARGYGDPESHEAIETLVRTGLVDDARYAEVRVRGLAARGAGDRLIRHTLAGAGIDADIVASALLTVAPETERAREIVGRRGPSARTARYLAGKGFSRDAVDSAVACVHDDELG